MVRENDLVAIFHSIHRVMQAERVLKEEGADILLIPAPRQLSADCGLAVRFDPEQQQRVETILQREGLEPGELYRFERGGYHRLR